MNRVMVYLTPGMQVNDYQEGKKELLNFKAGEALWSAAGGIHVAEVTSEQPITIVEMELRKPTGKNPATTLDPLKVDAKHYKIEFENDQVRVFRVKIGPHESTPMHEHVLSRVVVYLTGQNFRVTGADGKVDPKGVEEARKKAQDVLKQLKAGGNFGELAKKYSEDPGSGKNGGSLGWIGKGRTVPEFEQAAFSLAKGATSDLVQSSYGFHIIRVDDKQAAHVKTLDEVKDQIEGAIKQQKAAQLATNQVNALLAQARSGGLDKAAATKGLNVINTDFVSRTDNLPGIGSSPQFMSAVFGEAEKAPPDQVQVEQGYAVFEVLGIKPASTPTFDEIRSRVEQEFRNERVTALLGQKTQELADRAKADHDLKKAAKEAGAAMKTSDFVLPDGQVPDIGSMSGGGAVAFTLKQGEISGPITNGTTGVVLSILDRQEPTAQDFEAKKDQIRDALMQNKQGEMFGLFVSNLRTQMEKAGKIKINPDEMKNLTRSQAGEQGE